MQGWTAKKKQDESNRRETVIRRMLRELSDEQPPTQGYAVHWSILPAVYLSFLSFLSAENSLAIIANIVFLRDHFCVVAEYFLLVFFAQNATAGMFLFFLVAPLLLTASSGSSTCVTRLAWLHRSVYQHWPIIVNTIPPARDFRLPSWWDWQMSVAKGMCRPLPSFYCTVSGQPW